MKVKNKITSEKKRKTIKYQYRLTEPRKMLNTLSISGTRFSGTYKFECGNEVPIYEVYTVHGLNQLIGYAKFNNQSYGNVYYRGECRLHPSLKPSLFRKCERIDKVSERISLLIQRFVNDPYIKKELKLNENENEINQNKVEGVLQHYGIPTRFIDVVDNHWIALWMGLNKSEKTKQINTYYHYSERKIPFVELLDNNGEAGDMLFQYILLLAVPFSKNRTFTGIRESDNHIEVDLRHALPSTFLRPHAQHGLVIKKKMHKPAFSTSDYDMASAVVGIIKIRIDRAHELIGNGELLTQNNLFPPPAYDHGYDLLLSRKDLFEGFDYSIAQYI